MERKVGVSVPAGKNMNRQWDSYPVRLEKRRSISEQEIEEEGGELNYRDFESGRWKDMVLLVPARVR